MDKMSVAQRSYTMSRIRSKETSIEKLVFSKLRRHKIKFSKHKKSLPGCPDIVVAKKKLAVFIDGDFWHGWRFSKIKSKLPKIYWREKIQSNINRDRKNRRELRRRGWKVLRVWEHQIKASEKKTVAKIIDFLSYGQN